MKFRPVLNDNRAVKKNGYAIVRKLHKLEKKKSFSNVYLKRCDNNAFVVLSCKHLAEFIRNIYLYNGKRIRYIENFMERTEKFITHLISIAEKRISINKHLLASYLKAYTRFFNRVIKERVRFEMTPQNIDIWNLKCLMAYTAAWGNK